MSSFFLQLRMRPRIGALLRWANNKVDMKHTNLKTQLANNKQQQPNKRKNIPFPRNKNKWVKAKQTEMDIHINIYKKGNEINQTEQTNK